MYVAGQNQEPARGQVPQGVAGHDRQKAADRLGSTAGQIQLDRVLSDNHATRAANGRVTSVTRRPTVDAPQR